MHTQLGRLRQAYAEDAPNFVLCVFQPTLGQLHRHSSKDALQADRSRTANVEQKKPLMERRSCSCRRERIYSYSYSLPDCCVQAGTERQEQPKRPKPTLPWEHRRRCKGSPALRACHSPGSPSSQCKASSSHLPKAAKPTATATAAGQGQQPRKPILSRPTCEAPHQARRGFSTFGSRGFFLRSCTGSWRWHRLLVSPTRVVDSTRAEKVACASSRALSQLCSISGFARHTLVMLKP